MCQRTAHVVWISWIFLLTACDARSAPLEVVPSSGRDTINVMTYNIFHDGENPNHGIAPWTDRRAAIVELVRNHAPDVVGLQEAKVWQVSWLLDQMPEYGAVARGPYEDPGILEAETVAVFYLKERFELRESGHFWYSETPDSPGSDGGAAFGDMRRPRMATWVRLVPRDGASNGFYVFNTHFISDGQAADGPLARIRSAEVLVDRISSREHGDAHFLAIGDFNTEPGTWPLRYLLGSRCESGGECAEPVPGPELPMIDAWSTLHPGGNSGTRCNAITGSAGPRVDYILIGDAVSDSGSSPDILSSEIVATGSSCPSDHRPVVAEIVLAGNG